MSKKLFLDRSYDTEFEASVVDCRSTGPERYEVVLDNTLFYPESGGQLPDIGLIGDSRVVNVIERGEDVVHEVAGAIPTGLVRGRVDWPTRFDHMQQHTGQHVLSRAFIDSGQLHTVSFHMGDDTCTIDLDGPYDDRAAERAEDLANRVIEENRPVGIRIVATDKLDSDALRRKVPDGIAEARLVEVENFDTIPCCGTHVRTTGEISLIKVLRSEKVKKYNRVYFKCGRRALADYREKHDLVSRLAARFTTSTTGIVDSIEKLRNSETTAQKHARRLAQRLSVIDARHLLEASQGKIVSHCDVSFDASYLKLIANEMRRESGAVVILGGADGIVVCAAADDVVVDIAAVAVPAARGAGGSGGGKGGFAQLKIPADVDMEGFLERIREDVKARM